MFIIGPWCTEFVGRWGWLPAFIPKSQEPVGCLRSVNAQSLMWGFRSSEVLQENRVRRVGSYVYEKFVPTGRDIKVFAVGQYVIAEEGVAAHAVA